MKHLLYILSLFVLCACTRIAPDTLMGIRVEGTPWQFAASLADGEGSTFLPERVEVTAEKAYIHGWIDTRKLEESYTAAPYEDGRVPAVIICDIVDGRVRAAKLQSEIIGIE